MASSIIEEFYKLGALRALQDAGLLKKAIDSASMSPMAQSGSVGGRSMGGQAGGLGATQASAAWKNGVNSPASADNLSAGMANTARQQPVNTQPATSSGGGSIGMG